LDRLQPRADRPGIPLAEVFLGFLPAQMRLPEPSEAFLDRPGSPRFQLRDLQCLEGRPSFVGDALFVAQPVPSGAYQPVVALSAQLLRLSPPHLIDRL